VIELDVACTESPALPSGVLCARLGPGANCSSAGSAIDVLFYSSVLVGALAVALAAASPPKPPRAQAGRDLPPAGPAGDGESTLADRSLAGDE
jgi:hypothetical protein